MDEDNDHIMVENQEEPFRIDNKDIEEHMV